MSPKPRLVLVAVLGSLLLSIACGGDDDPAVPTFAPETTTEATGTRSGDGDADGGEPGEAGDCEDATGEGQAGLEMRDNAFVPRCLRILTSQGLRIHNEGDNEHNFSVQGFGLDVDVSAGDENNTEATGLEPGTYTFFCKYHRASDDMEGSLVVERA